MKTMECFWVLKYQFIPCDYEDWESRSLEELKKRAFKRKKIIGYLAEFCPDGNRQNCDSEQKAKKYETLESAIEGKRQLEEERIKNDLWKISDIKVERIVINKQFTIEEEKIGLTRFALMDLD